MFRRVRYRDLDQVRRIFISAFREEYGRRGVDIGAQVLRWKRLYPLLKGLSLFPNPYRHTLEMHVWDDQGRLLGFIQTTPGNREQTRWHIDFVAVAPEAQGRGIGRRLVEGVFDTYGARGVKTFTLEVDQDNAPALGFYDKLGFRRYSSTTYFRADQPPPPDDTAPTVGFRPYRRSDAQPLFQMYTDALPAAVRAVDGRTVADFDRTWLDFGASALRRRAHQQDEQRWVLEEHGQLVGYVRVVAQWRELPHTVHVLALPGRDDLYPRLLAQAARQLAAFPPRTVLAWGADHTPGKLQALRDWGLRPFTVDHALVRDNLITLKLPPQGLDLSRVDDKSFKPAFTQPAAGA
ncbi:MAG: GNAT family N-acetyltransferase [Candidatus Sericytochromatia bacterium]|nr:GNAT family N-acetyltransferase [Candidatus Sericytochromatia bacterium]